MNIRWLVAGLGLVSVMAFAARPPASNTEVNSYLHCINSQTQIQRDGPSGKLTDANAVINACKAQKQDLQNASPETANDIIARVEEKLMNSVAK